MFEKFFISLSRQLQISIFSYPGTFIKLNSLSLSLTPDLLSRMFKWDVCINTSIVVDDNFVDDGKESENKQEGK
jgi:hypothetical protein